MLTVDTHSHLGFADMAQVHRHAVSKRLEYVGMCEHTFKFTEVCEAAGVYKGYAASTVLLEEYICNTNVSSKDGLVLMRGLELDLGGQQTRRALEVVNRYHWDFICGSIHFLDGVDLRRLTADTKRDRIGLWSRYLKEQIRWMKSGLFDFLAHPLRLAAIIRVSPEEIQHPVERLVQTAGRLRRPVEINAIDHSHAPELVELLIAACADYHVPVAIASDASMPAEIGRRFDAIEQALCRHGIEECVVYCSRMPMLVNIHSGRLTQFGVPAKEEHPCQK